MRILCIGLSHKTADLRVREQLALDARQLHAALADLRRRWPAGQFLLLCTCNRIELYAARPVHEHPREQELLEWLGHSRQVHHSAYAASVYTLTDADAAAHLFEVAAGLDSMVPGEDQIIVQLKEAFEAAKTGGAVRGVMSGLYQKALHVAKHVRSETPIAQGKVSVASVAVDCVEQALGSLAGKAVLCVGAGKMNALMLKHLRKMDGVNVTVTNRSAAKARELAGRCGGTAVPFEQLPDHLAACDVLLTSTASPQPIITADMMKAAQRHRKHRPLLIVDIAVPRDVEAAAGEVKGVQLFNIDDLQGIVQQSLRSRLVSAEAAKATVTEHVEELMRSLNVRSVAPTIDALYGRMKVIADEELAAAIRKLSTHDDADADELILRRVLHRTIQRILHPAAHNLRKSAGSDLARAHVAAIRKLFELGE